MTITLEQFQKAVAERRRERKHGARKYEGELVAFAVAHTQTAVEQGRSVQDAAKELGITMSTLQSWQRREPAAIVPPRLREVVVTEPQHSVAVASRPATTLTLTTSHGHVVRGLNVEQVIALLQVLS